MTPSVQQAVTEWRSQQPDLIYCEQHKGTWTLRACKAFHASKLNYKTTGARYHIEEDPDDIAYWFDKCVGCEHFTPAHLGRLVKPCEIVSQHVFKRDPAARQRLIDGHAARRAADAADPDKKDMFAEDHGRGSFTTRATVKKLIARNPNAAWRKGSTRTYG